jgi:hypothetical protein
MGKIYTITQQRNLEGAQLMYVQIRDNTLKTEWGRYQEPRNLALRLIQPGGHVWATCTVNPSVLLNDRYVLIKTWSENDKMNAYLIEAGVIELQPILHWPTGRTSAPLYRLTERAYSEAMFELYGDGRR